MKENKYYYAREVIINLRSCHAITAEVYIHWLDKLNAEEKQASITRKKPKSMKELQISRKVYTRDELIISEVATGYAVELTEKSIVGVVWKAKKQKALLIETDQGVYAIANHDINIAGSGFSVDKASFILERKAEIKEIFIFKSVKKAYKWLAKRKQ